MAIKQRGHLRPRGRSIEVRAYAGDGRVITRSVRWQGSDKATRRQAEKELSALLREIDENRVATGGSATFATLAEAWWDHRRQDWSPSTAAGYRSRLDHRILPHLGPLPLRKITPAVLAEWQQHHAGTAAASRAKAWHVVRQILEHGRRIHWLSTNPAADLRSPTVPPPTIVAPDTADVERMLAALAAANPAGHLFVVLLVATGARRGEIAGLKWSDVGDRAVTIRRSVVRGDDGAIHVRPWPKGKRARTVSIDASVAAALVAHREACQQAAAACGVSLGRSGFVFAVEPDGLAPWAPDRVTKLWMRTRKRLDLDLRLHDLRHYSVTRLLDAGFSVADVAARHGHAHAGITTRLYAHATPTRDAEMAEAMGRLLG